MKINKFYTFTLLAIAIFLSSCTTEDKIVDQVFETTTRGAILRTLETGGTGFFNAFDNTTDFTASFEAQDQQNGGLLESVEVYISFIDRTPDNGDDSAEEILDFTIPASDFTTSSNGLPSSSFAYALSDMEAKLGLTMADYTGGDQFSVRLVYQLTDGRSFTNTDASGNIASGSFFRSPYQYLINVVCIPTGPVPGDYTIEMQDSYGDGWQTTSGSGGDGIQINIDGTLIEVGLCSPYNSADGTFLGNSDCTSGDYSSGVATVTIPSGAADVTWSFPGDFFGEITAQIYGPNGDLAAEIIANSPAGEIVLSLCP